jgi:ATP-dependent DNA helicase Q1
MTDLDEELCKVNLELAQIEEDLNSLYERQQELVSYKDALEKTRLHVSGGNVAGDCALSVQGEADLITYSGSNFPWSDELTRLANHYWGISAFRHLQRDIMNAVLSKRDALVILPTGR